jgi:hypothetical protein
MPDYVAVKGVEELDGLLGETEYTIVDFWATW